MLCTWLVDQKGHSCMGGEMCKWGSHAQARQVMSVGIAVNQRPSAWSRGRLLLCGSRFMLRGNMGLVLSDVLISQEQPEIGIFMWGFLISKCIYLLQTFKTSCLWAQAGSRPPVCILRLRAVVLKLSGLRTLYALKKYLGSQRVFVYEVVSIGICHVKIKAKTLKFYFRKKLITY